MARVSKSVSWAVPGGDFGALRLTAEVFMAHSGITVQVRNGGTVIGKQGSSLGACLCLVVLAPTRLLPKRIRIDVVDEGGLVQVQASLDDSFFLPKLSGLAAGRYRRQFDQWLEQLNGQILPSDIPDEDGVSGAPEIAAATPMNNGHAQNEQASVVTEDVLFRQARESEVELIPALSFDDNGIASTETMHGARVHETSFEGAAVESDEAAVLATSESRTAKLGAAPTSAQEQASKKEPTKGSGSSKMGGFRLPRFGFGGRKRDAVVIDGELPEESRLQAALADEAVEAKAWPRALTHYDAAVRALPGTPTRDGANSTAVSRLFFRRGLAHFTQAQSSLGSSSASERSVSDYQIAIEMTRQAVADYSEAIRLDPDWSMAHYRRGEAHLYTARCERGSRSFRQASEDLNQAIEDLTRATERNPTFASAFAVRAVAHALLDHDQESEADVEKAASLGTNVATLREAIQASKSWRA